MGAKVNLSGQISSLKRRIAAAQASHTKSTHLQDRLVDAVTRQIRRELREERRQARAANA